MPKGKPKSGKRDRQSGMQRKHEVELERIRANNELMRDVVKYVGEDIRSQLLLVALTGTSLSVLLEAYQAYVKETEADLQEPSIPEDPPKPPVLPIFAWLFMAGGVSGVIAGVSLKKMFDTTMLGGAGNANNPWGLIGGFAAAATTTAGLAWAALFAAIILGEGGLGGLLENAGGGGFGAMSALAGVA